MDELAKRKAVEHNDLITSVAKMDKTPLKMFSLAVSCIDTVNPPENNTVYLSKKELFAFFDVKDNDKHARFKKAVEKMQKQAYFQIREKKGKGYEVESIVPIPYVKWNDFDDFVTIEFNSHIMPYLIDLQKSFTQFNVLDLAKLQSKYSVVLYKLLMMSYRQYENYKNSGTRTKKQLLELQNPIISMSELRRITNTQTVYEEFRNFERRVLKMPIDEINQFTMLNVEYTKIREGRGVAEIQFHLSGKTKEMNEFYKDEQQDEVYLESEEQRERLQKDLFAKAMTSNYTGMLLEAKVIEYRDIQDIKTMVKLQQKVYPLYDKLEKMGGVEAVKKHMEHISDFKKDYSKKNTAEYVRKCAENWINGHAKLYYS